MPGPDLFPPGTAVHRLEAMLAGLPGERVSIGTVIDGLGAGTWGMSFLILGMAAMVPGVAPAFGVALCLMAAGLALGRNRPWLPRRLRRWQTGRDELRLGLRRLTPLVAWVEARLRRISDHDGCMGGSAAVSPAMMRVAGVAVLLNAVLVVLPIPFGNTAPALAVLVLALSLIMDNRLAVAAGLALSLVALIIDVILAWAGWQAIAALLVWLM